MSSPEPATNLPATRWSAFTRVAFRLTFCYFVQYIFCCGNVTLWQVIPFLGGRIEFLLARPYRLAGRALAIHLFHLHGASARIHASRTTDKADDYLAAFVMLLLAIAATAIWTAFDSRRARKPLAYPTLYAWLRFGLRLALGLSMLTYAFIKIFPIQFPSPSLAVLNEPLGQVSPMTLLWSLLGSNHTYELVCGLTEAAGGLLLFYRRTALAGALFCAFVLSNVFLYNLFFDVPVKLYAANILLMAIILIVPDIPSLFRFFWRHQPVVTTDVWVPPTTRRSFRRTILIVELLVLVTGAIVIPYGDAGFAARERQAVEHPTPLIGQWHLDAAVVPGTTTPRPFATSNGLPMTDLFLEPNGRTNVRSGDDRLWRGGHYDAATDKLFLYSPEPSPIFYTIHQPDPNHLLLTLSGAQTGLYPDLSFTRVPLPQHYRLYERGFHFINEWGFER